MLTSIVAAIVILGLLIIVHESGHFMVAKRLGVRVLRFSIGYPPRILGIRRGETEYVIGGVLFGGYVRMLGEEIGEEPKSEELYTYLVEIGHDLAQIAEPSAADSSEAKLAIAKGHETAAEVAEDLKATSSAEDAVLELLAFRQGTASTGFSRALKTEETILLNRIRVTNSAEQARKALQENPPEELLAAFKSRAFPNQPLWKRFAIVLAGPAANILFAPILLAIVFMWGVPTLLPVVGEAKVGMPAALAGLRTGDRIVSVNHKATPTWNDFSDAVKATKGAPLDLEVMRAGASAPVDVTLTPKRAEQKTIYGTMASDWIIGVTPRGDDISVRLNPFNAIYHAVETTASMTAQLVVGFGSIISGKTSVREAVGGPIMIAQLAGREAHQGFASIALFMVMLSLNLGIINLLPVPLLDGGHLAFFVFEGLRGKPLAARHREIALQVGLFLIVALMAFAIFNDISRLVQG